MLLKRVVDILVTVLAAPFLIVPGMLIAVSVALDSPGGIFFRQERVGRNGRHFNLIKFRTMVSGAGQLGGAVTSRGDPRVTRTGRFLRKWKLDELPQLINVLKGDMSLVGPRPEVPKYVALWPNEDKAIVLSVRPGLTDFASIEYVDEEVLLANAENPQVYYAEHLIPLKLQLSRKYVKERSMRLDLSLILQTVRKIVVGRG